MEVGLAEAAEASGVLVEVHRVGAEPAGVGNKSGHCAAAGHNPTRFVGAPLVGALRKDTHEGAPKRGGARRISERKNSGSEIHAK